jgi:nitrite reductase/ring-hydroxylating ferredoxin subunit
MMSQEANDLITRTGRKDPCGRLMRSYWQPTALVDELDGPRPVRPVRLLGENLVLFRGEDGSYGLIDRHCAHRGADLAFGRLENGGLRCAFHGWLFDTSGQCIETPAEPTGSQLCKGIKQRSYPVVEKSGILWAWLGEGAFVIPMSTEMTITQWHVPVDDENCYWYAIFTSYAAPVDKQKMRDQRLELYTLPDYKSRKNKSNDYGFDPHEQATETYTGMGTDINVHDQWAVESMGPIQDRTNEHLGQSDKAIVQYRRLLRQEIEKVGGGEKPMLFLDGRSGAARDRRQGASSDGGGVMMASVVQRSDKE